MSDGPIPPPQKVSLPASSNAFDEPSFTPPLQALLELLRREGGGEPDPLVLGSLRESMPSALKALLLALGTRGGFRLRIPQSPSVKGKSDAWVLGKDVNVPELSEYAFTEDDVPQNALVRLASDWGVDRVVRIGKGNGGDTELFATWQDGDPEISFYWLNIHNHLSGSSGDWVSLLEDAVDAVGEFSFDNDDGQKIGLFDDAMDGAADVINTPGDGEFLFEWIHLTRAKKGADEGQE